MAVNKQLQASSLEWDAIELNHHERHLGHANKDGVGLPQGPSPRNYY